MKKAIFFVMTLVVSAFFVPNVFAAGEVAEIIGGAKYATLEEAVAAANAGAEIKLLEDVVISGATIKIEEDLTINLNNHSISRTDSVFEVKGAEFNLVGPGEVIETTPDYGAITVRGSENSTDTEFTVVNVGEGVKLTAWSPINIQPINKTNKRFAYGVVVNINGELISVKDKANGTGSGVYVNGFIQHTENAPVINLNSNAKIDSIGAGVYLAGYAILNVNGATIVGEENAIGAKAGVITVEEGSVLKATGDDKTPTITYGDGINASGAAIQLESNSGYAGKIILNIKGGQIISENGYAVYEYLDAVNADSAVEDIAISGGEFKAADGKEVFLVSDSFDETNKEFITGGTFSSSVKDYLAEGLTEGTKDNNYQVQKVEAPKDNTVNPDTADLNIVSVVIALLLGLSGILYTVRKRRYN